MQRDEPSEGLAHRRRGTVPATLHQHLRAVQASRDETEHEEGRAAHAQDLGRLGDAQDDVDDVPLLDERRPELHRPDVAHGPETAFHLDDRLGVVLLESVLANRLDKVPKVALVAEQATSLGRARQLAVEVWRRDAWWPPTGERRGGGAAAVRPLTSLLGLVYGSGNGSFDQRHVRVVSALEIESAPQPLEAVLP